MKFDRMQITVQKVNYLLYVNDLMTSSLQLLQICEEERKENRSGGMNKSSVDFPILRSCRAMNTHYLR
jgi:hypothetical protein